MASNQCAKPELRNHCPKQKTTGRRGGRHSEEMALTADVKTKRLGWRDGSEFKS